MEEEEDEEEVEGGGCTSGVDEGPSVPPQLTVVPGPVHHPLHLLGERRRRGGGEEWEGGVGEESREAEDRRRALL